MTNDAERVSDIVARLRPSFNTDLPVSHAIDKCREEELRNTAAALSRWLVENNALKAEAITIIEAQSKALAEARAIIAKYWDGVDMLNDGPDDSDVAYAMGQIGEAHKLAGPIAETYRTSITPTPENPNG